MYRARSGFVDLLNDGDRRSDRNAHHRSFARTGNVTEICIWDLTVTWKSRKEMTKSIANVRIQGELISSLLIG